MLHTELCDLIAIESPIIQAAIAPYTSADLVAAVSNAGGLGSLGSTLRPVDDLKREVAKINGLTKRPFAINFTINTFDEECFRFAIEDAKPKVISCALGTPKGIIKKVHDAGILFMHQVHTAKQAQEAAELGVDVIIAQGSEAGGFCASVGTMSLVPQVVDIAKAKKIPVVAAGGIADGRGLAAAMMLGAQGANIGTRFLVSTEATLVSQEWKQKIVSAQSEDAVRVDFINNVFPVTNPDSYKGGAPRALRTSFVDEWSQKPPDEIKKSAEQLRTTIINGIKKGKSHEYVPFTGQSAGMISNILPAAEIIRDIVREAEETIRSSSSKL